jgi:thiol-disulfide isomerase/thioredoxin
MKTFITFIALLACITANAQKILKTDSVYITGKVNNFEKFKDNANSVDVIINDMVFNKQLTYRGKIASDGRYRLVFLKSGPQDVMLQYNEDLQDIIVNPGDHMQLDFDADRFESSVIFKGDGAQTNRDHRAYQQVRYSEKALGYGGGQPARSTLFSASEKDSEPGIHKKFLTDRYIKEKAFLTAYLQTHQLSPNFVEWAIADLKYGYFDNLMRYVWMHPLHNKLDMNDYQVPDSYYDFIKDEDLENANAAISSSYGAYVAEYKSYFTKKALGKSYIVTKSIDLFLAEQPGLKKDLMLSQVLYSMIDLGAVEIIKEYLDKFKANVTERAFSNAVEKAYNNKLQLLNNYTMPITSQINNVPKSEADSVFSKIVAKYAGKVVYIDFWATWCGPCRAEMPNSKKLRTELAGRDVVFVYLGVQSEEKLWKSLIAEMGIDGEHFLLDNKGFGAMSEKFQISGIPHYVLVDKKGRVADDNAKRPGDGQLKLDIEKLMAAK